MPTGPPPAIRTGTSFMGFLRISRWAYSARRAADLCSGSRRPDGGPSSLSGRRLLHSANHISGKFAGWQILFFATVLFSRALNPWTPAKPLEAAPDPSSEPSWRVHSRYARSHHRGLLINHPERPIEHIALRLRFFSSSHFSSAFRRRTGLTPTDFRKTCLP
jgi:AraC-like DNA-binding protein